MITIQYEEPPERGDARAKGIAIPANLLNPAPEGANSELDPPIPIFATNFEGALYWFANGFTVMPMVPGEKRPAVKKFDWMDSVSEASIRAHWGEFPDHEVGAILTEQQILIDADTPEALEALVRLAREFKVRPWLIIKTRRGEHHHFQLMKQTFCKTDAHSTDQFPERLDVRAVPSSILLVPSKNKSIVRLDIKDRANEVGQDFIDALFRHNGRPAHRPDPDWTDDDELKQFTGNNSIAVIAKLVAAIDPDLGYQDWLNVLMAIFHETGGSGAGLDLADAWSRKGKSYKDRADIETKWKSFRRDVANPITVGTLIAMAKQAGADVTAILQEDFEPCDYKVIDSPVPEPDTKLEPARATTASPFLKYSLIGRSAEYQERAQAATPLLGDVCQNGEITVWYARPNSGKTLLALHLIMEAVELGRIDPGNIFLINADDSSAGMAEKMALFDEIGAHTLVPGQRGFKAAHLEKLLLESARNGTARGTLIILDTAKRFVDLMHKREASEFASTCRQFTSAGGTVLALAHTNKNEGPDGKLVPAGTTDLLDDSDAAYIIDVLGLSGEPGERFIEFERRKARGGGVQSAVYSYAANDGLSYVERLTSVKRVDPDRVDEFKQVEQRRSDAEVIEAASTFIEQGVNTKRKLAKAVAEQLGVSRRAAVAVIVRYTGDDPEQHRWTFSKGARGAMVYTLLRDPDEAESTLKQVDSGH